MPQSKRTNAILMVVGAVIALFFLLADTIGVGKGPGVGYKQIIGALVGALIFVIGLIRGLRK